MPAGGPYSAQIQRAIRSLLAGNFSFSAGGGSATFLPSGVIHANTTPVGNITTGEDDLMSYTLPANTLNTAGKSVRITAWGQFGANGNTKTVKLHFGGTSFSAGTGGSDLSGAFNNRGWWMQGVVARVSAGNQTAHFGAKASDDSGRFGQISAFTKDETTGLIIKATGEGTDTDDVVQRGMLVEIL